MFKGRGQPNEGELLFVSGGSNTKGYVLNVLTDMYSHRLEEEITKLLRKKEKQKEYQGQTFVMENAKDWRGNGVTKNIRGHKA